jgi:pimeloyl-ACP methyl ester carboxylesterase
VRVGPTRPVALTPAPSRQREREQGTIAFSHANGFPAGTYRMLFEAWQQAGWRVIAVPRYGHEPGYPVTGSWPRLREQLADFVRAEAPGERVVLVGHSLGGYLSLMVAARHPELAAGVVMLDSPLVAGWRAHSLHVAKLTGLMRRFSPARVSQGRRWQWPSREAALAHFRSKSAFARWDPAVLADYIASGIEPDPEAGAPDTVRLAFRREIETRIYETLPHKLMAVLRRHPLQAPVAFVGGRQSEELRRAGLEGTRRITRGQIQWIEGSHLFPMERPGETAAAVLQVLASRQP